MQEETGLVVRPRRSGAGLRPHRAPGPSVEYHYVIIDYACDYVSGELRAGSDADEVALVAPDEIGRYDLPPRPSTSCWTFSGAGCRILK